MSETASKEVPATESAEAGGPGASLPGVRGNSLPGMRAPGSDGAAEPSGAAAPPAGPPPRRELSLPGLPPPPRSSGGHGALPPRPGDVFDEDQERWLIQKEDKLDYGPFSMREVRSQIEQGKILADHFILDNETNDRRRVADNQLIGAMAREWTAKHAELDRQMRDQAERNRYRDRVVKLLSGIFAIMVVVGAGVGAYFKFFYKEKVIVKKEKETVSDADFFKGMQFSMKVDPPAEKKKPSGKKRGPKNGSFDDTQNMNFDEGGDTLPAEDINRVMGQKFSLLAGCVKEEAQRSGSKKLEFEFIIKGSGNVSSVKVNGSTSSPAASCVFAKMQSIQFPECKTCTKTHATFSLSMK
jgi:hypothetical protein